METTAKTELCGILLHPASHTRSPAMHGAAYATLGLDAAYLAFDVPPERLPDALAGLRAVGARQLSVSIPHKEAILPLLDAVDETARAIGAVNTVVLRDGRLEGSNTDWLGAMTALEGSEPLASRHAVVLGAGGTARAVVYGLLRSGAEVTILNRSEEKARALASELGAGFSGPLAALGDLEYDLLVNTTSVGLDAPDTSPVEAKWLKSGTTVLDAVYSPEDTRLLRDARAAGATPIEGKWMLIHQAVAQLEAWTAPLWTDSTRETITQVMAKAFDAATP